MPKGHKNLASRRSFLASCLALAMKQSVSGEGDQVDRPAPVRLGHGLEVRDYRLFPTKDVRRFIVELHNTTDNAVETPAVGIFLDNKDANGNFGWAVPTAGILHPAESTLLVGIAPEDLRSDHDWEPCTWLLCDNLTTSTESESAWNLTFKHKFEYVDDEHLRINFTITNLGNATANDAVIHGLVRDTSGRLCGAMLPVPVGFIPPGETGKRSISIRPGVEYAANPFALISSVEGLDITFGVQRSIAPVSPGCPRLEIWDR